MDWFSVIFMTIIWFVLFSMLFLLAKQDGRKSLAQFYSWLVLATPIWPIASLVIACYLAHTFFKNVIETASQSFKDK